jgi:DNA-binding Xre family transcriptional regulator
MKLSLDTLHMYCTEEGDCLLWNLSLNSAGKPQARLDGQVWMVQRYVYSHLMGKQIQKGRVITTRCLNPICCAPGCLVQMTYGDLIRRSYKDGSRSTQAEYAARLDRMIKSGKTKLDAQKAAQIRASDKTCQALAEEYGVHNKTISCIKRGKYWRQAPAACSVFEWARAA